MESISEKNGRRLANVKLEGRLRTHGDVPDQESMRGDIELTLNGQFMWDLGAQRIDAAAITGKVTLVVTGDREITTKGAKHKLNIRLEYEGTMQFDLETAAP